MLSSTRVETSLQVLIKVPFFESLLVSYPVLPGLKKVEKSQMTHKNPELRASSVVTADAAKKPVAPAKKFGGATDVVCASLCTQN